MHQETESDTRTAPPARVDTGNWLKVCGLAIALAACLSLAALAYLQFAPSRAAATSICDKYAATDGSDSANGTKSAPFRTAQKLADSLEPGQTGCLRAGTYTQSNNQVRIGRAGITLRSAPGERATIRARVYVPKGADRVTVRNLNLDGSTNTLPSPTVNANHTRWLNNSITNQNTTICFSVGHPRWGIATGTIIRNNAIHRCGKLPRTNHHHGIYVGAARDTRIIGNRIHNNADRAIQLYPDAQGTIIRDNVIRGNGQGIVFSGKGEKVSSNSTVVANVIVDSRAGWNVFSNYNQTDLVGRDNVVRDNCLRASHPDPYYNKNGGVRYPLLGFKAHNNRIGQCT
jgi:parallel beta-helix repeat protein